MRLVCPNCEAKYEVPDDAIPDTGRDVQCASCSHAWFQMRPRAPVASPVPIDADKPIRRASKPEPVASEPAEPEIAAPEVAAPEIPTPEIASEGPSSALPTQVEAETLEATEGAEPPVRAHDEKVLTILREEAEREAKARRERTRPLGYQADLGIESAMEPRKKAAARKKDAGVQPGPESDPPPAAGPVLEDAPAALPEASVTQPKPEPQSEPEAEIELKIAARRDLLPDVEEIKSTLQQADAEEPEFISGAFGEGDGPARGGAFRSGFLSVITVAILAASLYISAPWLAAKVPALADALASYVAVIDDLRLALDGMMRSATLLIAGDNG